jgi:hypothetical protein
MSAVCASESLGRFGGANVCADRYVVGPAVEAELAGALSLDAAALFTRVQMQGSARAAAVYPFFSTQRSGTVWEFPMVAKYRLRRWRLSPYVGIGPSFRRIRLEGQNTIITFAGPPTPGEVTSVSDVAETRWQAGVAMGGGFEFRTRFVRFLPELRYSRWASGEGCKNCDLFTLPAARSSSTVFLFGFGF